MIESKDSLSRPLFSAFRLKGFRCFEDLTLPGLGYINLIAGKNNVGKTAALEGMFLHSGIHNAALPVIVNALRGIESVSSDYQDLWGWLFPRGDTTRPIELSSVTRDGLERKATIRLAETSTPLVHPTPEQDITNAPPGGITTSSGSTRQLLLDYADSSGAKGRAFAFVGRKGIEGENSQLQPFPICEMVTPRARTRKEDAERFSKLEREGRQDEIVESLRILEPRLRKLSVLVSGGVPLLHGDLGIGRLLPIAYMGEGLGRLLSLLLTMRAVENGLLLVDEIETGLHHSALESVWRVVADAASRHNVQIIATTHSYECIRAAHQAFIRLPSYPLKLVRLDFVNGNILPSEYDRLTLETALREELEIR